MGKASGRVLAVIKVVVAGTVIFAVAASVIGFSVGLAMVHLDRSGLLTGMASPKGRPTGGSVGQRTKHQPRSHPVVPRAMVKKPSRRVWPPVDPDPSEMIVVSLVYPETVTLWRNGEVAFQTYCNTGVPGAGTPVGLYRIRAKLPKDNMRGHELDGRPYNDPGVPWVMYFHGGDALHGFERSGFGWPQSLGCVELPIPAAAELYQQVYVGTRVLVFS